MKFLGINICLIILVSQYGFSMHDHNKYTDIEQDLFSNNCTELINNTKLTNNKLDRITLYYKNGEGCDIKFRSDNKKTRRKITITLEDDINEDNRSNCNITIEALDNTALESLVNSPKSANYKFLDTKIENKLNNNYENANMQLLNKNINHETNSFMKLEKTADFKYDNNITQLITNQDSTRDNKTNTEQIVKPANKTFVNKKEEDRDLLSEFIIQKMLNQSDTDIDKNKSFEKFWENKENTKPINIGNNIKLKKIKTRNNTDVLFNNLTYDNINNKTTNNIKVKPAKILKPKNLKKLYKPNTSRNYISKNNVKNIKTNTGKKPAVKFQFTKKIKLLDINTLINVKKNNITKQKTNNKVSSIEDNKWRNDPALDKETNERLHRLDIAYNKYKKNEKQ